MNGQNPQGGYRDEREAALAQAHALQQQLAALEPEVVRLRQENQHLRAELARYAGFPQAPAASRSRPVAIALVAAVAALVVAGAAGAMFLTAGGREPASAYPSGMPSPQPVPSSAPSVAPMPMPAPVSATSQGQPTS
jgi:hypothetical protein